MEQAPDILDIVFSGRNKAYGAYELRRGYPKHVAKAIFFGSLAVLFLFLIPYVSQLLNGKKPVIEEPWDPHVFEVIPDFAPVIPSSPNKSTPPEKSPTTKAIPVVKPDDKVPVDDPVPDAEVSPNPEPGTPGGSGDPSGGYTSPASENGNAGDIDPGLATPPPPEQKDPDILNFTDEMPEFPGGEKAMYKYLRNIKYPAAAKENNIYGRVTVRFVVNEDGKVSNVSVLKGIGAGCDEEAKRVISTMPKWKPGKKKGRAVKVYYTIPVTFKLE